MADLQIRTANADELAGLLSWAAVEGWNPGLDDAEAFLAADRQGFLIGCHGTEPVAGISAVRYSAAFGFVGLFIVVPQQRGQGLGRQIWQAGLARLEGATIGLDAVVAQQANYRRWGFELAYRTLRFGGPAPPAAPPGPLVPLAEVPLDLLGQYDRRHFPASRANFLAHWRQAPRRTGWAVVDQGCLRGYSVARRCGTGWKIGPLFADDAAAAERLFLALACPLQGQPVYLDVPEPNTEALDLARRWGLEPVFETGRMYAGPPPEHDLPCVYGVTTLELG